MSLGTLLRLLGFAASVAVLVDAYPPARAGVAPSSAKGAPARVERALGLVPGGGALASGYRLRVSDLPPPPGRGAAAVEAVAPTRGVAPLETVSASSGVVARARCPVEVRAVVMGEERGDSFAVLATGGDSRILRVGEGLRAGAKRFSVARIEAGAVTLRAAEGLFRCDFLE